MKATVNGITHTSTPLERRARRLAGASAHRRRGLSEIMTDPVQTVANSASVEEAINTMATAGTRRLVVTEDGTRVAGVLSLDDVLELLARQTAAIGRLLEKQQPKIPA
jgi:CBS domain-containing protein